MEQALMVREIIVKFFKRYEIFILPVLKFILGWYVFSRINGVGHIHEAFEPFAETFNPGFTNLLLALMFTVMPTNMSWVLIILSVTIQFSANVELAVAVFVFLLFVFLFYARMAPKESILILFTIIAFNFNIPYLVPIMVGLYFKVTAVIPVIIGVFINAQIPVMFRLMAPGAATTGFADMELTELLTELPAAFSEVYGALMSSLAAPQGWIFTALIFSMVAILVYFVSRQSIDYAKEIAIGLGAVMTIFGFIVSVLFTRGQVNIGLMIIGAIVCTLLAFIIRFFDGILDYQRAESVQFEDDKNYYHVKIVPKIVITKTERVLKRIRPERYDDHEE